MPAAKKASKKKAKKKSPAKKKASKKKVAKKRATKKKASKKASAPSTGQLPFEGNDTQTDMLYPAGTIAHMLGITDRHLRRLANEGIVPKATRGRYKLAGCVQGYIGHLQSTRATAEERAREHTRLNSARADTYELDLQIKRKELYPREVVDEAMFGAATTLTAMLDGTASRIASQLGGGAALRERLVNEFREIRTQFAAGLREFSERLRTDGWDSRPAARPRTRKVGKRKSSPAKRKR